MCIGTRVRLPRDEMIRVVRDPDGRILVDRHLKAPGRGAHLAYDRRALEEAVRRRAFGRAFEAPVQAPTLDALERAVLDAIDARVADLLALGRRSGGTVSGLDVLERQASRLHLVVVAEDAAAATAERLGRLAGRVGCPIHRHGQRAALGAGQGKDDRVAVGVVDPALAARLERELGWRAAVLGAREAPVEDAAEGRPEG